MRLLQHLLEVLAPLEDCIARLLSDLLLLQGARGGQFVDLLALLVLLYDVEAGPSIVLIQNKVHVVPLVTKISSPLIIVFHIIIHFCVTFVIHITYTKYIFSLTIVFHIIMHFCVTFVIHIRARFCLAFIFDFPID